MIEEKKDEKNDKTDHLWYRRHALGYMGWAGVCACALIGAGASVRFGYPRVLYEPSGQFKAGMPDDYRVGEVSTRWVKSHRVWIVREKKGFYALYAYCTHLGCTPGWLANEKKLG